MHRYSSGNGVTTWHLIVNGRECNRVAYPCGDIEYFARVNNGIGTLRAIPESQHLMRATIDAIIAQEEQR